jgi:serine/threonine-protein kinase
MFSQTANGSGRAIALRRGARDRRDRDISGERRRRGPATIRETPPDKPIDLSIDAAGEIFAANENGNVRAYAGHNNQYILVRTVAGPHTQIQHPVGIAVDFAGSFYVADAGAAPGKGRLEWFAGGLNGNIQPNRVISGPHTGIGTPRGVALDASGRAFVTDQASNKVLVFDSDANGDAAPIAVMTGLHSPRRVFVDQLLDVYVTNKADNSVSVFTSSGPESWSFSTRITSAAMRYPAGVSGDAQGRIAVAQVGGILFFAPNAQGVADPVAELRGPSVMNPAGICIH